MKKEREAFPQQWDTQQAYNNNKLQIFKCHGYSPLQINLRGVRRILTKYKFTDSVYYSREVGLSRKICLPMLKKIQFQLVFN